MSNVRELNNVFSILEEALVVCSGECLSVSPPMQAVFLSSLTKVLEGRDFVIGKQYSDILDGKTDVSKIINMLSSDYISFRYKPPYPWIEKPFSNSINGVANIHFNREQINAIVKEYPDPKPVDDDTLKQVKTQLHYILFNKYNEVVYNIEPEMFSTLLQRFHGINLSDVTEQSVNVNEKEIKIFTNTVSVDLRYKDNGIEFNTQSVVSYEPDSIELPLNLRVPNSVIKHIVEKHITAEDERILSISEEFDPSMFWSHVRELKNEQTILLEQQLKNKSGLNITLLVVFVKPYGECYDETHTAVVDHLKTQYSITHRPAYRSDYISVYFISTSGTKVDIQISYNLEGDLLLNNLIIPLVNRKLLENKSE